MQLAVSDAAILMMDKTQISDQKPCQLHFEYDFQK